MSRVRFFVSATALISVLGMGGSACEGGGLRSVRKVTYPPDFHYITRDEIRTTMGQLAAAVGELDGIMEKEGGPLPEDRETVVATLTRMKSLAAQLKKGADSNHPRIHREVPRLRDDIQRALDAAMIAPPNYYPAGRVVGACTYCHEPRHSSVSPAD